MTDKKVYFYISIINGGGAARVMILIAEGLARRGFQCTLITTSRDSTWEYPLSNMVERIVLEREGESPNVILKNIRRTIRLRKICRTGKPDFLITFLPHPIMRSLAATIGLHIKNIISIRNDPSFYWKRPMERIVSTLLLPRAYWAVFQTKTAQMYYAGKRLSVRSQVIPNPIDAIFYSAKYNPNSKIVVASGRLAEQKNYPMLIRAFAKASKDHQEWTLAIYGEGPLEEEIDALIREIGCPNIHLLGHTDNMPQVLSNAGIFVLTSDYEGMPNALMEALAVGVPCISTDCPCGGPKSLINNNANGYLIPVKGEKELYTALTKLIADQNERIRLSDNASKSVSAYKEEIIIDKWESMLSNI